MSELFRSYVSLAAGLTLAVANFASFATVVSYSGVQGPPDFPVATPPMVLADIANARQAFSNVTSSLGSAEFEYENPALVPLTYTDGEMTFSGGATKVNGNTLTDFTLGRYNMSQNPLGVGYWLESQSTFSVSFTGTAITAFSFFATDLGDYDGTVDFQIFGGSDNRLLYSQRLANEAGVVTEADQGITAGANGNLLYFGVTSNDPREYFTSIRFTFTQGESSDLVGFDSLVVGQYVASTTPTVPEPGSLALAGLALFAAGYARKARKAA